MAKTIKFLKSEEETLYKLVLEQERLQTEYRQAKQQVKEFKISLIKKYLIEGKLDEIPEVF